MFKYSVDYEDANDQKSSQYFDILNTILSQQHDAKVTEDAGEPTLYTNLKNPTDGPFKGPRTTSKSSIGSNSSMYSQNGNQTGVNFWLRRNAGGGGSFLVNDFLCRDLLYLLKDLIADLKQKNFTDSDVNQYLTCSIVNKTEYNLRLIKLQQLINETIWRFHIVKNDSIPSDYGKIAYFQNTFEINKNDELLTNLIIRNQLKNFRKTSNPSNRTRSSSANTHKSSIYLTSVHNNQYRCMTTSSGSGKRRTNSVVMKLLADTESLCVLCLKESRTNEANQLLKLKYNNTTTKQFAFEQVKFYLDYEQVLCAMHELNSQSEPIDDLALIQLFKMADRLIENEDGPLQGSIVLTDLITVSQTNLGISKNLIDYTLGKLEQVENPVSEVDREIHDKLKIFLKNVNVLLRNANNMTSFTKFLGKFNSISLCAKDYSDDSNDEQFMGLMDKYRDLNESLNELKTKFDSSQGDENQNLIYLDLVGFIKKFLGLLFLLLICSTHSFNLQIYDNSLDKDLGLRIFKRLYALEFE